MYTLNQSLIKEMFFKLKPKEYCPRRVYEKYFLLKDCTITTEAQIKGNYFEALLTDMPPPIIKARGKTRHELPVDYIRLQEQAKIGRAMFPQKLMFVYPGINTQVILKKQWNPDVLLIGTLDLFPTLFQIEDELRVAIIDFKTTKDLNSTWGPYGWGDYQNMDWLQGAYYHELVRNIDWNLNNHLSPITVKLIKNFEWMLNNDEVHFFFWVFDMKPIYENKFLEVNYDYNKQLYLSRSIDFAVAELDHQRELGFPPTPGNHCFECMLDCEVRQMIKTS